MRFSEGSGKSVDLDIKNISKTFGSVAALRGVNLEVGNGEFVTILGASGSGKTTLLKIIAGFELPDTGQIVLNGNDITYNSARSRNIGMVFQNYALFPHMTVADNIAFPLKMRRVAPGERVRRAAEALRLVELEGLGDRQPAQLSGGQQQRVALARSIVFKPSILLLDEPFGALDRRLRESMQLEVRRLQQRLELTTLFITHDQEEALTISDRIAIMHRGQIEQVDTPTRIYESPRTQYVASFVGESNLLPAELARSESGIVSARLASGDQIKVRALNGDVQPPTDQSVMLLMRPEKFSFANLSQGSDLNCFPGRIIETIYVGTSMKFTIETDSGLRLLIRVSNENSIAERRVGDRVSIAIAYNDCQLMPADRSL